MEISELNNLGSAIIASAFDVRNDLGPFVVEKIYEEALMLELQDRGINVRSQQSIPVYYKGRKLDFTPICDLVVENEIILELKAVPYLEYKHVQQILSYLHIADKRLGYLINFRAPEFRVAKSFNTYKDNLGIYRFINKI